MQEEAADDDFLQSFNQLSSQDAAESPAQQRPNKLFAAAGGSKLTTPDRADKQLQGNHVQGVAFQSTPPAAAFESTPGKATRSDTGTARRSLPLGKTAADAPAAAAAGDRSAVAVSAHHVQEEGIKAAVSVPTESVWHYLPQGLRLMFKLLKPRGFTVIRSLPQYNITFEICLQHWPTVTAQNQGERLPLRLLPVRSSSVSGSSSSSSSRDSTTTETCQCGCGSDHGIDFAEARLKIQCPKSSNRQATLLLGRSGTDKNLYEHALGCKHFEVPDPLPGNKSWPVDEQLYFMLVKDGDKAQLLGGRQAEIDAKVAEFQAAAALATPDSGASEAPGAKLESMADEAIAAVNALTGLLAEDVTWEKATEAVPNEVSPQLKQLVEQISKSMQQPGVPKALQSRFSTEQMSAVVAGAGHSRPLQVQYQCPSRMDQIGFAAGHLLPNGYLAVLKEGASNYSMLVGTISSSFMRVLSVGDMPTPFRLEAVPSGSNSSSSSSSTCGCGCEVIGSVYFPDARVIRTRTPAAEAQDGTSRRNYTRFSTNKSTEGKSLYGTISKCKHRLALSVVFKAKGERELRILYGPSVESAVRQLLNKLYPQGM